MTRRNRRKPQRRRGNRPALGLSAFAGLLIACHSPPTLDPASETATPIFVDRAAASGLELEHVAGRDGAYRMPEIHGAGAALFDADGDGDLDLFLPQGNYDPPRPELVDRLFRRDGPNERPEFVDITFRSGVGSSQYSTGAAAGDFDGDGAVDLYVTALGADRLWRNRGDGTFEDVTNRSGLRGDEWTVGASWVDIDRDGDLDLFQLAYLAIRPGAPAICPSPSGEPDYCGPTTYEPRPDRLWRNRGDGTFEDASGELGLAGTPGSGLGIVSLDANQDGWLDLYVANDKMPNFLWQNLAGERFEERALELGAAVNETGAAEAGMGVDASDFDGDGDEDLAVAHLAGETHTLYRNEGGWFVDDSRGSGLSTSSLGATGFGLTWLDADGDGRDDLLSVHGHVHRLPRLSEMGDPFPYHQKSRLWLNRDGFRDAGPEAGPALDRSAVARGLAIGDVDDDGDPDAVVTAVDAPVALWINQRERPDRWLGLRLVTNGRDSLGTVARTRVEDRSQHRRARTDGSYGSSRDPRLLFAWPSAPATVAVEISWLSGSESRFETLRPGFRYVVIENCDGLCRHDPGAQP